MKGSGEWSASEGQGGPPPLAGGENPYQSPESETESEEPPLVRPPDPREYGRAFGLVIVGFAGTIFVWALLCGLYGWVRLGLQPFEVWNDRKVVWLFQVGLPAAFFLGIFFGLFLGSRASQRFRSRLTRYSRGRLAESLSDASLPDRRGE